MAIIQLLLALIILGSVYRKMMRWNSSGIISKKQAYIPIALGVVSTVLSAAVVIGVMMLCLNFGYTKGSIQNPVANSLVAAFLGAGLVEELVKLLMILLSIRLFHPKNVYECALIGGAVGIGFTLCEEFLYSGSLLGFVRFINLLLHAAFGIVMGKYIGVGMYRKQNALPYKFHYALSIVLPVTLHTLYDACTACNPVFKDETSLDDEMSAIGVLIGLACVACSAIWQCIVIKNLKKNANEYSMGNLG